MISLVRVDTWIKYYWNRVILCYTKFSGQCRHIRCQCSPREKAKETKKKITFESNSMNVWANIQFLKIIIAFWHFSGYDILPFDIHNFDNIELTIRVFDNLIFDNWWPYHIFLIFHPLFFMLLEFDPPRGLVISCQVQTDFNTWNRRLVLDSKIMDLDQQIKTQILMMASCLD